MPYDKIKKEDLWGVIGNGPAPDEAVEAVEIEVDADGVVIEKESKLHVDFSNVEMKFAQDIAAEQAKLAGEIQGGINQMLNPATEIHIDMGESMMKLSDPGMIVSERDPRQTEQLVWYPRKADVGAGYDDNTAAVDPIQYTNIVDLLARFFIQSHAMWGVIKNWRSNIIGCTSICFQQGIPFGPMHMPMLDYDGKNVKKIVRKDVKTLQKDYGLGNAWVYETRRGFHVYFFTDVVTWDQYHEMLEKVHCCKGFKRASINRGYAVLRVSAKYTDFDISLLYVLESGCTKLRRLPQKAHVIQALIKLGQDCALRKNAYTER